MSRLMQALVGISVIAALPALARAQCPPLWAQETAAAFNGAIRDFTQWNGGLAAVGGFTQRGRRLHAGQWPARARCRRLERRNLDAPRRRWLPRHPPQRRRLQQLARR